MEETDEIQPKGLASFVKSQKGRVILAITAFILVFGGAILAAIARSNGSQNASSDKSLLPGFSLSSGPSTKPALLTGINVDETKSKRRPLAVMVENHPDARPQAGLVKADMVFEAIVEGGITRFMAVFSSDDADKIGPIRSSRPFYVHWAAGLGALYVHAGGSQGALALIPTVKQIVDLPHSGAYFQREPKPGIASEHTLFSSTEQLYRYAKDKEVSLDTDINSPKFEDDAKVDDRPAAATISIPFSSASYSVNWDYERDSNKYKRSLAAKPHVDRVSGDQITVSNVAVLEIPHSFDPNTNQGKGEWSMPTEGSGKLKLFQDGTLIEGSWKKTDIGEMIQLLDSNGKVLPLIKGKTWFEIVPPDVTVTHEEQAAESSKPNTQ